MDNEIYKYISKLYSVSTNCYILRKYVNTDFWINELKSYFPNCFVDNLTCFNYDTSFNICINISDVNERVGTQEFNNYIMLHENLYRIQLQISVLGQFATLGFVRYRKNDESIFYNYSETPYLKEHLVFKDKAIKFLNDNSFRILSKGELDIECQGIIKTIDGSIPTVYNFLFSGLDEYVEF